LNKIKRRNNKGNKSNNKNSNRKMDQFSKKKLPEHEIIMAYKYGFKVYLVNPSYTSKLAEKIKEWFKLDRHIVSVYTLALKYLCLETFRKLLDKDFRRRLEL